MLFELLTGDESISVSESCKIVEKSDEKTESLKVSFPTQANNRIYKADKIPITSMQNGGSLLQSQQKQALDLTSDIGSGKSVKRRRYHIMTKTKLIEEMIRSGCSVSEWSRHHDIPTRNIRRWREQYDHLFTGRNIPALKIDTKSSSDIENTVSFGDLEKVFHQKIQEKQFDQKPITAQLIKEIAIEEAINYGISGEAFGVYLCWIAQFLHRHHLLRGILPAKNNVMESSNHTDDVRMKVHQMMMKSFSANSEANFSVNMSQQNMTGRESENNHETRQRDIVPQHPLQLSHIKPIGLIVKHESISSIDENSSKRIKKRSESLEPLNLKVGNEVKARCSTIQERNDTSEGGKCQPKSSDLEPSSLSDLECLLELRPDSESKVDLATSSTDPIDLNMSKRSSPPRFHHFFSPKISQYYGQPAFPSLA